MPYTSILTETRGRVAVITFNRPQALNALNFVLLTELAEALTAFDADDSVGALVVTRKAWDGLSPAGQAALRSAGDRACVQMRLKARAEVDEAGEAMKKRGLVVNRPSPEQMREWNQLADKLYPRIRGTMVPADTFDEVFRHLTAFRAGKGG